MDQQSKVAAIATLLEQTQKAHHDAFLETDGDDPEWPLWYAEWLQENMSALLGANLTRSELVYHIIDLDRRYEKEGNGRPWPEFYAQQFVESYN